MRLIRRLLSSAIPLLLASGHIQASNPRWTTGQPYFNVTGTPVSWYTMQPRYYTDPGDLSPYVNHAAADALVAAASAVWNVPTSSMDIEQGGLLAEQVSGNNVSVGINGPMFPADVQSSNYPAIQIAVIYDRDGSVTELLLGGGSSAPVECLHSAVTESVDSISPAGRIQHAILILNGRCTGPAPEQQLQMRYQLERAFGRVLGLGWSQANDNVFTGVPQPTYDQALHWPIMHPIDVICGPYSFLCLPQPFTLRADDIASINFLYGINGGNPPPGKQFGLLNAMSVQGNLRFPTQEGMGGVNVVVRRNWTPEQKLEPFDEASTVTGVFAQQLGGNPITPKPPTLAGSFGALSGEYDLAGYFHLPYIPLPDGQTAMDILLHSEPLNPLYVGEYSLGPYTASTVTPSGTTTSWRFNSWQSFYDGYYEPPMHNLASNCATTGDGTQQHPAAVPAGGWWTSVLCGINLSAPWSFAHTSWVSLPVQANRSLTVEMTGQDETGAATANKVRPALGVWKSADAPGSSPSMAAAAVAFNGVVLGMTSATTLQTTATDTLRIALASETGDGRPDYNYQARVLYADTIAPGTATAGTLVTVTGLGFRPGNTVTLNGVAASVSSWTSTSIALKVPFLPAVAAGTTVAVDVAVTDISTRGTTVMKGAFAYVYTAPVYTMQVVSHPGASQIVSLPASPPFTVKILNADGVTPLAGASAVFSTVTGSVSWSVAGCAGTSCTVTTDATGTASVSVTPLQAGSVTLQAAALGLTQQVSFNAVALVRTASVSPVLKFIAAGATVSWPLSARFLQQTLPTAQVPVAWTATSAHMAISAAQTATDSTGTAGATATAGPLATGAQATGTVCGWATTCVSFAATGIDPGVYVVVVTGGAGQIVPSTTNFSPITIQVTDTSGHGVEGAAVQIHQSINQWTAPCVHKGRCPTAPVLKTADSSGVTDANGNLTIAPQAIVGPEVTNIVVSSGKHGYASLTLQRNP